jgi:hypothetical protein
VSAVDGSWTESRPPPPANGGGRRGISPAIKRPVAYVAAVAASIAALMWLLSFVPGAPTASFWPVVVFPCFALAFPVFAVTIVDEFMRTGGGSNLRSGVPLRLPGWRAVAAGVLFFGVWLTFAATFFGGSLNGQPFERDGRYFTNNHGVETEVTRQEWANANASSSRLFAGGVLVFAGISALALTAPDPDPDGEGQKVERKWLAQGRSLSPIDRYRGFVPWRTEVQTSPEVVLERLRKVVPLMAAPGRTPSTWTFVADWDQAARWPSKTFPLRLEGTVTAVDQLTSSVDAVVAPASRYASLLPFQAIWGVVVVGIGVFVFVRLGAPPGALLFVGVWAAWGLFIVYTLATAARRAATRTIETLTAAIGG